LRSRKGDRICGYRGFPWSSRPLSSMAVSSSAATCPSSLDIQNLLAHPRRLRTDHTSTGKVVRARRVVVATAIGSFTHLPAQFQGLPGAHISHGSQHADLNGPRRRCWRPDRQHLISRRLAVLSLRREVKCKSRDPNSGTRPSIEVLRPDRMLRQALRSTEAALESSGGPARAALAELNLGGISI